MINFSIFSIILSDTAATAMSSDPCYPYGQDMPPRKGEGEPITREQIIRLFASAAQAGQSELNKRFLKDFHFQVDGECVSALPEKVKLHT